MKEIDKMVDNMVKEFQSILMDRKPNGFGKMEENVEKLKKVRLTKSFN